MKKHDIIENITIDKLIFGGAGLATASDGRKIIVSGGAIPGAICDLRITKAKKNHLEAQIYRTVKKSPLEMDIPSNWQLYGGCKWLPIPYPKQLEIKEQQITEAFYSLKDETTSTNWHTIIRSPDSEHYRNKVEFSWGKYISDREGVRDEYRFGFHVQGQFDRIENCWYCVLADDLVNQIYKDIDGLARKSGLPTYDPKTAIGFWRHLVIRRAKITGQVMIIFSVNANFDMANKGISGTMEHFLTEMVQQLSEKYKDIRSMFVLENTGRADIVQGNQILLYGENTITDELLGLTFEIQPKSFFQVNTLGAEKLYQSVIESIHHKGGILLDLYAGTGTIGILLSKSFKKVYSVELVTSSSQDGEKNAVRNSVNNVEFINQKVEDFAVKFAADGGKADTIVLDPPRDGLHPSAIPHILGFGAKEIIYVSCNPATLVRDISIMLGKNINHEIIDTDEVVSPTVEKKKENTTIVNLPKYRISDITPMDMFPHTHHIETVVRLERIKYMKPELISFIQQIPLDTLIVIEGNSELVRNGDVHFPFRQSSDVLYLTDLDIPDIKLTIYNSEVIIWRYPITDKEILWGHNKIGDDEIKHISGISDIRNIELFDVYYAEHSNLIPYPEMVTEILQSLRIIKNPSEIKKIKTAIEITQKAFDHIAGFIKPGMYEYEIEAEMARIFRSHHMTEAYPTIVASGPNACILHYTKHTRQICEGDMVLIDAGAEYMGYASDMTRTLSVGSGFSHRQQELYDTVSRIKEIAENNLKPGVVFSEYEKNIREAMNQELVHLGLIPADATEIEKNELSRKYYPHRTSHFLGLDVHDVGDRDIVLQEGMVLTIEPGIYIREESIGIRLEDDYIITSEGCECLG